MAIDMFRFTCEAVEGFKGRKKWQKWRFFATFDFGARSDHEKWKCRWSVFFSHTFRMQKELSRSVLNSDLEAGDKIEYLKKCQKLAVFGLTCLRFNSKLFQLRCFRFEIPRPFQKVKKHQNRLQLRGVIEKPVLPSLCRNQYSRFARWRWCGSNKSVFTFEIHLLNY